MTIIGVGLLGGSLAKACRKRKLAGKIVGFGRKAETLKTACAKGVIDDYSDDLATSVKNSDLVVICTPVRSIASRAREMLPSLRKGCVITDVGSVKGPIVREIEKIVAGTGVRFIGSHPIAGGEKSGFGAADENLFEKAKCIITPTAKTNKAAKNRIAGLWEAVGAQVVVLDADEHDVIYGAVSHMPHLISYALVNALEKMQSKHYKELTLFCGNGLRDATRLASSDSAIWRDICLANRKSILKSLDRFQKTLEELKSGIERGDADFLSQAFTNAKNYRSNFSGKE